MVVAHRPRTLHSPHDLDLHLLHLLLLVKVSQSVHVHFTKFFFNAQLICVPDFAIYYFIFQTLEKRLL